MSANTVRFEGSPPDRRNRFVIVLEWALYLGMLFQIVFDRHELFEVNFGLIHILAIAALVLGGVAFLWVERSFARGNGVIELDALGARHTLPSGKVVEGRWSDFEAVRGGRFCFRDGVRIGVPGGAGTRGYLFRTVFGFTGDPVFLALARRAYARAE